MLWVCNVSCPHTAVVSGVLQALELLFRSNACGEVSSWALAELLQSSTISVQMGEKKSPQASQLLLITLPPMHGLTCASWPNCPLQAALWDIFPWISECMSCYKARWIWMHQNGSVKNSVGEIKRSKEKMMQQSTSGKQCCCNRFFAWCPEEETC